MSWFSSVSGNRRTFLVQNAQPLFVTARCHQPSLRDTYPDNGDNVSLDGCVRGSDNRVWKIWFGNARDGTPLPNQEAVVILHKKVAIWTSLWMPRAETSTDLLNRLLSSSTTAAEWSTTSTNGHSIIPPRAWIICSVSPRIEHFASHLTPDTPDFRQHLSV